MLNLPARRKALASLRSHEARSKRGTQSTLGFGSSAKKITYNVLKKEFTYEVATGGSKKRTDSMQTERQSRRKEKSVNAQIAARQPSSSSDIPQPLDPGARDEALPSDRPHSQNFLASSRRSLGSIKDFDVADTYILDHESRHPGNERSTGT